MATENELDFLERYIPLLAEGALNLAYVNALASGESVLIADGDTLYEVFPSGERVATKKIQPDCDSPTIREFLLAQVA